MLKTRLVYGFLFIVAACAIVVFDTPLAPYYPLFAVAMALIVVVAARELAQLLKNTTLAIEPWFCVTGSLLIILGNWLPHVWPVADPHLPNILAPLGVFVAVAMFAFLLAAARYTQPGYAVTAIAGHLFVFFYLGVLGSFVAQVRWLGDKPATGAMALFLTLFTAKFCDIAAYFAGRAFGKHKMSPALSPGKTWEGFAGGVVGAVLLALTATIMGEWLTGETILAWHTALLYGLVFGIAAPIGDLMESLIKRDCRQKDASHNIPGFGGLLDVIDSVLFCGPVSYVLLVGLRQI